MCADVIDYLHKNFINVCTDVVDTFNMTPCRRFWEHPADDLWTTPCRQSPCRPFSRHTADIKISSAQTCFYRLQGVLKNVCREDCLQGVVQRSSAGCFQNNVCELQNFLWAAGCHVCREPPRLTAQTKRSSAGCFLGLVMYMGCYSPPTGSMRYLINL